LDEYRLSYAEAVAAVPARATTRLDRITQQEEEEANYTTWTDFGLERHKEWKKYGADFCNQRKKINDLAPEKKTKKRRQTKIIKCTVFGHQKGHPV
jgi:hypothetical protein